MLCRRQNFCFETFDFFIHNYYTTTMLSNQYAAYCMHVNMSVLTCALLHVFNYRHSSSLLAAHNGTCINDMLSHACT